MIDSPVDLRRLSGEQLEELAAEIRQFSVRSVSASGGHLGSNLGVVELTLALHRVFDSPPDVILWDTGHQPYRVVVTAEDGVRRGGAGSAIESALSELTRDVGAVAPSVVTLGLPDAYIPQGRTDALLSDLGLDGDSLAATALAGLGAHQLAGRA